MLFCFTVSWIQKTVKKVYKVTFKEESSRTERIQVLSIKEAILSRVAEWSKCADQWRRVCGFQFRVTIKTIGEEGNGKLPHKIDFPRKIRYLVCVALVIECAMQFIINYTTDKTQDFILIKARNVVDVVKVADVPLLAQLQLGHR